MAPLSHNSVFNGQDGPRLGKGVGLQRKVSNALAAFPSVPYAALVSTVAEIKEAVAKLPPRKKQALARWLQNQVDDHLSDEEMMAIAAEGARAR